MDMVDNMKVIPGSYPIDPAAPSASPVGVSSSPPGVAPGTQASPYRYSMGSTGSISDAGSGIAPTQYHMDSNGSPGAGAGTSPGATPQASNALSGGPSIASFYGR